MKNIVIMLLLLISFVNADFIRDDKKEVVTDSETCLMWEDNNASKIVEKNWQDAIGYCEELTLGDYDDWRLPNINELKSITDKSRYKPANISSFENIVSTYYWSSTTNANSSNDAWTVSFYLGNQYSRSKDNTYYVRCVRTGE